MPLPDSYVEGGRSAGWFFREIVSEPVELSRDGFHGLIVDVAVFDFDCELPQYQPASIPYLTEVLVACITRQLKEHDCITGRQAPVYEVSREVIPGNSVGYRAHPLNQTALRIVAIEDSYRRYDQWSNTVVVYLDRKRIFVV